MIFFIKKTTVLLLISIALIACQATNTTPGKSGPTPFFSLNNFFQLETARLAQIKQIDKKVTINGQTEKQTIDQPEWEKAFKVFTQSDINKPAWSDKYKADTSFSKDQSISSINYSALDEGLKTRVLSIDYLDQEESRIYILNEVKNPILSVRQELTYERDKGYLIKSWQKQMMAKERSLEIEVNFR